MPGYSDKPEPPFPDPEVGSIFDAPDMVWQSPTTGERVVDTQSGFLVVVKYVDGRLELFVKRRVGTPPKSSVLLTPDESKKLARILTSLHASRFAEAEVDEGSGVSRRRFAYAGARTTARRPSVLRALTSPLAIVSLALLLVCGVSAHSVQDMLAAQERRRLAQVDPLSADAVEKFARGFAANMLDFNQESYRFAQLQAMSCMSPEVLDCYLRDTKFPQDPSKLQKGSAVAIGQVSVRRVDPATAQVSISGQVRNPTSGTPTPIKLSLQVSPDASGKLTVTKLQDALL